MMKSEFEKLVEEDVSGEDYLLIERVYTYHPCISETKGKEQIAYLYKTFGMRVILDMLSTADKAAELEEHIRNAQNELNSYKAEYNELRTTKHDY